MTDKPDLRCGSGWKTEGGRCPMAVLHDGRCYYCQHVRSVFEPTQKCILNAPEIAPILSFAEEYHKVMHIRPPAVERVLEELRIAFEARMKRPGTRQGGMARGIQQAIAVIEREFPAAETTESTECAEEGDDD